MRRDADYSKYVEARWRDLVRAAIVLGCESAEAEDLVQTTLLRCYTRWSKVQNADNPNAYVYRILLNCFRDSRRKKWWSSERPTDRLPELGTDRDVTSDVDTRDAVQRALAGLSVVNREVVILRHFAQLSELETAALLRVPPGTVKSRLSRALGHLSNSPHLQSLGKESNEQHG